MGYWRYTGNTVHIESRCIFPQLYVFCLNYFFLNIFFFFFLFNFFGQIVVWNHSLIKPVLGLSAAHCIQSSYRSWPQLIARMIMYRLENWKNRSECRQRAVWNQSLSLFLGYRRFTANSFIIFFFLALYFILHVTYYEKKETF